MIETENPVQLLLVLALVVAGVVFLNAQSPPTGSGSGQDLVLDNASSSSESARERVERKATLYEPAKELNNPSGFINSEPFTLQQLVGDKVILLDMWTYSCINCQRTLPHLKQWWLDYGDDGLVIVGNHAPEFAFEKDRENVERAVERFNVTYPVVMDNDYGTWRAYNNRYWPQKYLIGVDGFIRYEHIGEGAYDETRERIEELLEERKEVLGLNITIERGPDRMGEVETPNSFLIGTPELYFGAWRNSRLANGESNVEGTQELTLPDTLSRNRLYLSGTWTFTREYASANRGSSIILDYQAKDVNMVLDSPANATLRIKRNGEPLPPDARGADVSADSTVFVDEERLYRMVADTGYGRHTLNITVVERTLDAYTFTFG